MPSDKQTFKNTSAIIHNEGAKLLQMPFTDPRHPWRGVFNLCRLFLSYQPTLAAYFWRQLLQNPNQSRVFLTRLLQKQWELLQYYTAGDKAPLACHDRRFKHETWQHSPGFAYIRDAYLCLEQHLQSLDTETPSSLTDKASQQASFFLRIIVQAISPNHWLNPEIIAITRDKHGSNLWQGLAHFLQDLNLWQGYLSISKTDFTAFALGENIAYTQGAVIYQNELMQLLQYAPVQPAVHAHPILIVTSWINKYYLFDLRAKNSIIHWLLQQGFTVFIVSWVNASTEHAHYGFSDYVLQGPVAAIDVIRQASACPAINVIGYCLGGTLLACALAYLAKKDVHCIASATYLASLLDYTEPGDLGNFMGEDQIAFFEELMRQNGLWDGYKMATAFNLLNMNDLIWPYFINQYLKGRDPIALDALYWASDITNTPAALYSFYMRSLHQGNILLKPNAIQIGGVPIDFKQTNMPLYLLGLRDDRIAPWRSCFASQRLYQQNTRFVLAGGDHFTGIGHPTSSKHYGYKISLATRNPEQWLKHATQVDKCSWWQDWLEWLKPYTGQLVAALPSGSALPMLEPAPGSYAKVTLF